MISGGAGTTTNQPETSTGNDPSEPTNQQSGTVVYETCKAAREAGAAPLYVGDPGYSKKLDRDGDGVACES
ncbi:excalibur calcium-binding domain-containing protein [Cohnella algarum]|uniref:excalibur calcium-binding domain-containing protein n=1 Tax=Cohnella algarum TaxID=2044859 RepID=UPI0030840884